MRTIVVWKHISRPLNHLQNISCVRTIVVWKLMNLLNVAVSIVALRENHSGMETSRALLGVEHSVSCVRTIVVWKLITLY